MIKPDTVYLVSACLLGEDCKYNGGNNRSEKVIAFLKDKNFIRICPETMGGLSSPREPSEIVEKNGERFVVDRMGKDVTAQFIRGAQMSAQIAEDENITHAILKARSPSCGVGEIYDGTFSHKVIAGNGITAQKLLDMGFSLITEEDIN